MSFAVVLTRANVGLHTPLVAVETHLSRGLPRFNIVGLPETAVKESKDRVRSAILQGKFKFPKGRITVNLAPADLPKEGGRFDLPIAISLLIASKQLRCKNIQAYELAGELALSGELRAIKGILPFALATQQAKRALILPSGNVNEATWITPLDIFDFPDFVSVVKYLSGEQSREPAQPPPLLEPQGQPTYCLSDVCGQHAAKRALEIAAAGGHSLLMIGPPGTGKTMLAGRLSPILPPLTRTQALEVASLYSISRYGFHPEHLFKRPFRQPHHTASAISLVGGGRIPCPGEISLAHQGILFLDELPEFSRHVLEVLREPLESGKVLISRAAGQAEYPAGFQLIAAMNPCPCGYFGSDQQECHCSREQVHRYRSKISGPLLDRIDLHIEVPAVPAKRLTAFHPKQEETSQQVQQRVINARNKQVARGIACNAALNARDIVTHCALSEATQLLLSRALEKLKISARAYHRILKVARTIADLNNSDQIEGPHIAEAIQYRKLDRTLAE